MRCLRKAVHKTRRDKMKNNDIGNIIGTTPLQLYTERINLFAHIMRMTPVIH